MAQRGVPAPYQQHGPTKEGLRIGCLNAHSMLCVPKDTEKSRLDKIKSLIRNNRFDVFVIVETWINPRNPKVGLDDKIKIEGYSHFNYPRELGTPGHGGILIYIRERSVGFIGNPIPYEKIVFRFSEDKVTVASIQLVVTRITWPVQLDLVAVYNPSRAHAKDFYIFLKSTLDSLYTRTSNVVVIGDVNIDLLLKKLSVSKHQKTLREDYKLEQLIEKPTHETACIDHIYYTCNSSLDVAEADVIPQPKISDHYSIFCVLRAKCPEPCNQTFANELALRKHQEICQHRASEKLEYLRTYWESLKSQRTGPTKDGLRIGFLNSDTFHKKDEKKTLMDNNKFDVFVIVEKRLEKKESHIIDGYKCSSFRGSSGWIIIYLSDRITYTSKLKYEYPKTNIHFVEIGITWPVQLDLLAVYNPSSEHIVNLYDSLTFHLDNMKHKSRNVMVMGDFNIDLDLDGEEIDRINQNLLKQDDNLDLIDQLVRVAPKSETYIYRIYYYSKSKVPIIQKGDINHALWCTLKSD